VGVPWPESFTGSRVTHVPADLLSG
jgi:hypothetical protein